MILSLQMPVVTLVKEIVQSLNGSHFNLSEVSERMQLAIERTVQAAEQVRPPPLSWDKIKSFATSLCGHVRMLPCVCDREEGQTRAVL